MKLVGQALFNSKFVGKSGTYYRGVDMETGGEISLTDGDNLMAGMVLLVPCRFEAEVKGVRYTKGGFTMKLVAFHVVGSKG